MPHLRDTGPSSPRRRSPAEHGVPSVASLEAEAGSAGSAPVDGVADRRDLAAERARRDALAEQPAAA